MLQRCFSRLQLFHDLSTHCASAVWLTTSVEHVVAVHLPFRPDRRGSRRQITLCANVGSSELSEHRIAGVDVARRTTTSPRRSVAVAWGVLHGRTMSSAKGAGDANAQAKAGWDLGSCYST
jgi:hypothetical protein